MINPRMLVFALSAVLLRPTHSSAEGSHIYAKDRDETNDHRSLPETVWGHPWYNSATEETNTDTDLKSGYHSLVGRPGRGYYPVKEHHGDEHSSSDFDHNPYYGYNGKGKGRRPGWGGKGYSKKGMKSIKGGKGKHSKNSKNSKSRQSSGYRPRPPKPHPPRPTLPPGPRPIQTVRTIPNFVISYVDPLVRRAIPTDEDFAELVDATTMWFERAVQAALPRSVNLVQTRSLIARTEYGAGIPLPRFNILIEYASIEMTYLSFAENVEDVPLAAELNAILLSSINEDYIFQVVRQIPAFATVNEVYAESIENTFDPLPTISPAPTTAPAQYTPSPEPSSLSTPSPSVPELPPSLAPSSALSSTPSLAPSVGNIVGIRVSDFFIAYLINEGMQPTDAEFAQLQNATESWFEFVVSSELPEGVILVSYVIVSLCDFERCLS